jgi:hypothetical protein
MDNEGGGNFFTTRYFGIPGWVILAGIAVLGYLYFRNQSGTTPTNQTSGGGGSVRTGNTDVRKGAIVINVKQGGGGNPQPGPNPGGFGEYKSITVPRNMTLDKLAKYMHWSDDTVADIEGAKQPSGTYEGQTLTGNFKLKRGDTIDRPIS